MMAASAKPWARDPLYYEGLQASQVGDWDKAEQAFAKLLQQYANDAEAQAEIQRLLDNTRLRQSLDKTLQRQGGSRPQAPAGAPHLPLAADRCSHGGNGLHGAHAEGGVGSHHAGC
ncbi:MAG: hypothetical protein ACUVWR_15520 [Anaerolineae bacterium]